MELKPYKMKLIIKKLQGGECTLEVNSDTTISEIKQQIETQLKVPRNEQKLLLAGKTLADEKTVDSYPNIRDGTKINLILVKPEDLKDAVLRFYKRFFSDQEAVRMTREFMIIFKRKINELSYDDLERIANDTSDLNEPLSASTY